MNFRRLAVVGAAIVVILVTVTLERGGHIAAVHIGQATFTVEIADKPDTQAAGLSNRAHLPADHGMLFIFAKPDHYSFWMRNMRFPLDIVWIAEGKVVAISRNLPPDGDAPTRTYAPPGAIDRVLEINAGVADAKGLAVGDSVTVIR